MTPTPVPVRLAVDREHPVDPSDPFLFHKTTLRSRYEEAEARHPDADDVILVNIHGDVTETARANLAVKVDGRWITPPLVSGLLPGCERAALLADGSLVEAPVRIDDLTRAEEIAYLNSVRGSNRATIVD
jgi:para-aminobenzoate synthetase/4-amino-4-deoxychorismate lyase